jgi:hypothetical protein
MLGTYYHTLDNRRLATLSEMQSDPRIALRMWALPRDVAGTPFFGASVPPTKRPWAEGSLAYPRRDHCRHRRR